MVNRNNDYSEDMFADTRMSFGDHIEELRIHLWRALFGFLIGLVLSFFIGKYVLIQIARPVENELNRFYDDRVAEVMKELREDPRQVEYNQPTGFTQLVFVRPQLEAFLRGMPNQELQEKFPRPVTAADEEEYKDVPHTLVQAQDLVSLWVSYQNPVEFSALVYKAQRMVGPRPGSLKTLNVTEAFVVYFKVCIVCGIVISSPWVFWQLWSFVAAGLYPHEKKLVHFYMPFSLILFLIGVFFAWFIVIPRAVEYLLWFNKWIGLEPDLRLNEWLGFALMLPLIFGVAFQLPLFMFFLERLGILSIEIYQNQRRLCWFVMAITSAMLTPPDAITLVFLWIPLCGLYELGIWLCKVMPKSQWDTDVPESEEMVEV
ncbi:MAG: twin-arginine translocase subunit TatC [Gemmataceae bacterium]